MASFVSLRCPDCNLGLLHEQYPVNGRWECYECGGIFILVKDDGVCTRAFGMPPADQAMLKEDGGQL